MTNCEGLLDHLQTFDAEGLLVQKEMLDSFFKRWEFLYSETIGFAYILNPETANSAMYKGVAPSGRRLDDYKSTKSQLKHFLKNFFQ